MAAALLLVTSCHNLSQPVNGMVCPAPKLQDSCSAYPGVIGRRFQCTQFGKQGVQNTLQASWTELQRPPISAPTNFSGGLASGDFRLGRALPGTSAPPTTWVVRSLWTGLVYLRHNGDMMTYECDWSAYMERTVVSQAFHLDEPTQAAGRTRLGLSIDDDGEELKSTTREGLTKRGLNIDDDDEDIDRYHYRSLAEQVLSMPMEGEVSDVAMHHLVQTNVARKCFEMSADIASKKDGFGKSYKPFSRCLKLGGHENSTNRTRVAESLCWHTSKPGDEQISRRDYADRMAYCITGEGIAAVSSSPFMATFPNSEFWQQKEVDGEELKCAAKEGSGLNGEDEKEKKEDANAEFEPLAKFLDDKLEQVIVSSRMTNSPCVLMTYECDWAAYMERTVVTHAFHLDEPTQAAGRTRLGLSIGDDGEELKSTTKEGLTKLGLNIDDDEEDTNRHYRSFAAQVLSMPMEDEVSDVAMHHPVQTSVARKRLEMSADIAGKKDGFEKSHKPFSRCPKLGVHEDSTNRTRVAESLRWHTSKPGDEQISRREYVDRMAYCITGESIAVASSSPFMVTFLNDEFWQLKGFDGEELKNTAKEGSDLNGEDEKRGDASAEFEPLAKFLGDKMEQVIVSLYMTNSTCTLMAYECGWSACMERTVVAHAFHLDEPTQAAGRTRLGLSIDDDGEELKSTTKEGLDLGDGAQGNPRSVFVAPDGFLVRHVCASRGLLRVGAPKKKQADDLGR